MRDLALCLAVLRDKLVQAEQNLHARAAPSSSGFTVSEDTWLILKRHRESQVVLPPEKNVVEGGLGEPGLGPQKDDAGDGAIPAEIVPSEPEIGGASSRTLRPGGT